MNDNGSPPTLQLAPHPSRRRNRVTGQIEPHITDIQMILLDGIDIGYCGAVKGRPITLTEPFSESERQAIFEWVAAQGLEPSSVNSPPPRRPTPPPPSDLWLPTDGETGDE